MKELDPNDSQANRVELTDDERERLVQELKGSIRSDTGFRGALMLELLKTTMSVLGFIWLLMFIILAIVGFGSFPDFIKSRIDGYLTEAGPNLVGKQVESYVANAGQRFKDELNRLSQLPSYATKTIDIRLNDSAANFVAFPFFEDLGRQAREDESEWFITLNEIEGTKITVKYKLDSLQGQRGLRFHSTNFSYEATPPGVIQGPAGHYVRSEPATAARVFMFAKRALGQGEK